MKFPKLSIAFSLMAILSFATEPANAESCKRFHRSADVPSFVLSNILKALPEVENVVQCGTEIDPDIATIYVGGRLQTSLSYPHFRGQPLLGIWEGSSRSDIREEFEKHEEPESDIYFFCVSEGRCRALEDAEFVGVDIFAFQYFEHVYAGWELAEQSNFAGLSALADDPKFEAARVLGALKLVSVFWSNSNEEEIEFVFTVDAGEFGMFLVDVKMVGSRFVRFTTMYPI